MTDHLSEQTTRIRVGEAVIEDMLGQRCLGSNGGVYSKIRDASHAKQGRANYVFIDVTRDELEELREDASYQGYWLDDAVSATPAYRRLYKNLVALIGPGKDDKR